MFVYYPLKSTRALLTKMAQKADQNGKATLNIPSSPDMNYN